MSSGDVFFCGHAAPFPVRRTCYGYQAPSLRLTYAVSGECYSTLDSVLAYLTTPVSALQLTYDVCCQWAREKIAPYFVPKFHVYAHKRATSDHHNLLYASGVGRTYGEGCERVWAAGVNPAAGKLVEIGPSMTPDTWDVIMEAWGCDLQQKGLRDAMVKAKL